MFAVSSDGKRFLRIRPSADGKVATIVASGIDGKVIGEYIFEVGDPAAWWYGWGGDKVFAIHSLPSGKWKYWVPGSKVAEISDTQLPAKFRNAIARSPNKDFHTSHPEGAEWTIGYLSDAPYSLIPESPYTFVGGTGIGAFDTSSTTFFGGDKVITLHRPSALITWWNIRYVEGGRFLAIGMDRSDIDPHERSGRPFLKTSAWLIDSSTQKATRLCYAVYAAPIP